MDSRCVRRRRPGTGGDVVIGQAIKALWEIGAATFIVLVILTVRKARARGRRLFRDEPNARIDALAKAPDLDHRWDA